LSEKIRSNNNFKDENGNFQRIKYEKFLLENNLSAPLFEKKDFHIHVPEGATP